MVAMTLYDENFKFKFSRTKMLMIMRLDCGNPSFEGYTLGTPAPDTLYEATVDVSECAPGYETSPSTATLTCTAAGTWDQPAGCAKIDCGNPSFEGYTLGTPSPDTLYGATVAVSDCATGYETTPSTASLTCTAAGTWDQPAGCTKINCGNPSFEGYTLGTPAPDTLYGATVSVSDCATGFETSPSTASLTCTAAGTWDQPAGCNRVDCGNPVFEGYTLGTPAPDTLYGAAVDVSECATGYETSPSTASLTCTAAGTWDQPAGCAKLDCGNPVFEGYTLGTPAPDTLYGATVSVSDCATGYETSPSTALLTCTAAGTWDQPAGCTKRDCGNPVFEGYALGTPAPDTLYGATVDVSDCATGYETTPSTASLTCTAAGTWDQPAGCAKLDCGNPSFEGYNLGTPAPDTLYGATVDISECAAGFETTPSTASLICTAAGTWDQPAGCSRIDCGSPVFEGYSLGTPSPDSRYGSTVDVSDCATGYETSPSTASLTCTAAGTWDQPNGCNKMDCGNPSFEGYSLGTPAPDTLYGATVDVSDCATGYETSPSTSSLTCTAAGTWDQPAGCAKIDCGYPAFEGYTLGTPSPDTLYGAAVDVSDCATGFETSPSTASLTCTAAGTWDQPAGCTIINCGNPSFEGYILGTPAPDTLYGATVDVSDCATGYETSPSTSSLTCTAAGTWDQPAGCAKIDCGYPAFEGYTLGTPSPDTLYGAAVDVSDCATGFETSPSTASLTCTAAGTWDQPAGCTIINCGTPSFEGYNLGLPTPNTLYGATVDVSDCATGYETSPSTASLTCTAAGTWDQPAGCARVDCGNPSFEGYILGTPAPDTLYGGTVDVSDCATGYETSPSTSSLTCTAAGSWDQPAGCAKIDCGYPAFEGYTLGTPSPDTLYGAAVDVSDCATGFETSPSTASLTCTAAGTWDQPAGCTIINCGTPSFEGYNLGTPAPNTLYGATVDVSDCATGYGTSPSTASLTCTAAGTWDQPAGCARVDCGNPSFEGYILGTPAPDTLYGATVDVSDCATGYETSPSSSSLTCTAAGTWDQPAGCAKIDCGYPAFEGYTLGTPSPDTLYGAAVDVNDCATGFETSPSTASLTCTAAGTWDQPAGCTIIIVKPTTITTVTPTSTTTQTPYQTGLLAQPSAIESSFTNTDDECGYTFRFPYPVEFQGQYFSRLRACTNGLVVFGNEPYSGWSVPDAGLEKQDGGFINRYMLLPFFTDIITRRSGRIYAHMLTKTDSDDLSNNGDVLAVNDIVKSTYKLQKYDTEMLVKVTWSDVAEVGGADSDTSTFQLIMTYNGQDLYVFYFYDRNRMNFKFGNPFIGWVAYGVFNRKSNSLDGLFLRRADQNLIESEWQGMTTYKVSIYTTASNAFICQSFVRKEQPYTQSYRNAILSMPRCPCQDIFFFFDRRFQFVPWWRISAPTYTTYMYPRRRMSYGMTCTYNTWTGSYVGFGPRAGRFNRWNFFTFPGRYQLEDEYYRNICCNRAGMCDAFNLVRPRIPCYNVPFFWIGGGFGDPHIRTLDDRTYSFNGHGEYILTDIPEAEFQIQARTARAVYSDGSPSDATIYSGFAVGEEGETLLQVELNDNRTGIYVMKEGVDITPDYLATNYTYDQPPVIISKIGTILQATFTSTGISINITEANGLLTISTVIPNTFAQKTSGLLGNFNGNPADEFIPRGSSTPIPNNSTDRTIFFDFAKTWTTYANESLFYYRNGRNHKYYVTDNADFVPKFLDDPDVNQTLVAEATTFCKGEENVQCIFDYVFTRNKDLAENTQGTQEEAQANAEELANIAPEIEPLSGLSTDEATGEQRLYLELDQAVTFSVNGSDDGPFTFKLDSSITNAIKNDTGNKASVSLTLVNTDPQNLSISVVDAKNLSAEIDIVFVLCSGCSDHGICNYSVIRAVSETNENFRYASCDCEPYWDGDDCELDFDGCTLSACSIGRNCTDRLAADHAANSSLSPYSCSPCPAGYTDNDGLKCDDIDECSNTSVCSQNCFNTPGSFYCTCDSGYRLSGTSTCIDINECDEQLSDCEQECNNTKGGFTCSCYTGYEINNDTNTCTQTTTPDPCEGKNCTNAAGCTLNASQNAVCFCRTGYELDTNDSCHDRNECDLTVCSQTCTNTEGSFTCGCYTGYKLAADRKTCTACQFPFYGQGCSMTCTCGRGSIRCDPVRGCVCQTGWTGVDCDTDIDECTDTNICEDENKVCTNTAGSYSCSCRDGYNLDNSSSCVDVDECQSSELNTCEQLCSNTEGGFTCSCQTGYVVNTTDSTRCTLFDSCAAGVSGCAQICVPTSTGFLCDCNLGFRLNDDRKTCRRDFDPCAEISQVNCSHACLVVEEQAVCSCFTGYKLGANNQTCIDINECDSTLDLNKCSEPDRCLNTDGGYVCSCPAGSKLEYDGRTCKACDEFHYGENCASQCNCGVGAERCDPVTGCVCKVGWSGLTCSVDMNECGTTVNPCASQTNTVCVNNPGSYVCSCQTGYQRDASNNCVDINECASVTLNDCEQICTNTIGSYECSCNPGFTASGNLCTDIDECTGNHSCSQECVNTVGSYRCQCQAGFRLEPRNLKTCIPESQCSSAENQCDANGDCAIVNGSPQCFCRSGFELDPYEENVCKVCPQGSWGDNCTKTCTCEEANTETCNTVNGVCTCKSGWTGDTCATDINECNDTAIHNCPGNSTCQNTNGSFYCQCNTGFFKAGDDTCQECDDTHYGDGCSHNCTCVTINTRSCDHVTGACACNDGWEGATCADNINECTTLQNPCNDSLKECSDTQGSYECNCVTGYRINADLQCIDINECLEDTDNCLQECRNTLGSFECYCYPGFLGAGNNCTACPDNKYDYNCTGTCDCVVDHSKDATQTCDTATGVCDCLSTWTGSRCETDVDECTLGTDDCSSKSHTTCSNIDGGFECNCVAGYQENAAGNCEECDDTHYGDGCSHNCTCVTINTRSCDHVTGACACNDGWEGVTCADNINECTALQNPCNDSLKECSDTQGSYECNCVTGYRINADLQCIDINECLEDTDNCLQECRNTLGSFECYCYPGFLGAGNNCTACRDNKYDYNCTGTCDCVVDHSKDATQTCDTATGVCDCLSTWTGTRCETDVDECTVGTDDCSLKPNTACSNINGGFECNCVAGYQENAAGNCEACPSNKYGVNCTQICNCVTANTNDPAQSCDLVTGVCDCQSGWNGTQCQADIDECKIQTDGCDSKPNQGCHNLEGSFECSCFLGYTKDDGGNCILSLITTTEYHITGQQRASEMYIEFDLEVTDDLNVEAANTKWKNRIKGALLAFYRAIMGNNVVDVVVYKVEQGSLKVNYTVVSADSVVAAQQLSEATNSLANGTSVTAAGTTTKAIALSLNNVALDLTDHNVDDLTCQIFLLVNGECSSGYQCTVEGGVPSCQLVKTKDNFALVVGLGVGIPLFFIAVLIVAMIITYAMKIRKRRHIIRKEEYDRGSINHGFSPTTLPTRIITSGRGGPVYGPQIYEEEGSTSASSDDRRERHYRQRQEYDNSRAAEMDAYDNGVMSNFTWDFLYNYINPNERFEINRPQLAQPNPMYSEKN